MNNTKGLYLRLKEANLIKEEKYISKTYRGQDIIYGAEIEVITKDDLRFTFEFWKDPIWRDRTVPQERSDDAELVDASCHRLYVDDHIYISQKGFLMDDERRVQIIKSIRDGSWEQDEDLWLLL